MAPWFALSGRGIAASMALDTLHGCLRRVVACVHKAALVCGRVFVCAVFPGRTHGTPGLFRLRESRQRQGRAVGHCVCNCVCRLDFWGVLVIGALAAAAHQNCLHIARVGWWRWRRRGMSSVRPPRLLSLCILAWAERGVSAAVTPDEVCVGSAAQSHPGAGMAHSQRGPSQKRMSAALHGCPCGRRSKHGEARSLLVSLFACECLPCVSAWPLRLLRLSLLLSVAVGCCSCHRITRPVGLLDSEAEQSVRSRCNAVHRPL